MALDPKIVELIQELQSLGVQVNANVNFSLSTIVPVTKHYYTVTEDKTNARSIKGYNNADPPKPIFQIYPNDSAPVSQRKQWIKGAQIWVDPTVVIGDGGTRAYKILEPVSGVTVALYLVSTDGIVV